MRFFLCLNVRTRWNSTYLILNVIQNFERTLERFDEEEEYMESVDKIGNDGKLVYFHPKIGGVNVKVRYIVETFL